MKELKHLTWLAGIFLVTLLLQAGCEPQPAGEEIAAKPGQDVAAKGRHKRGAARWRHGRRRGFFRGPKLSDEQRARMREILSQARQDAKQAKTPQEKRKIFSSAFKKVHADVLTDEQRARVKKMRETYGLNLTDQQKKQMKAIWAEACEKAKAAKTPQEKREILRDAWKRGKEVLTDEQRAKAGRFWRGRAGRGMGWHGKAGCGRGWHGKAGRGKGWHGKAVRGKGWHGKAEHKGTCHKGKKAEAKKD